jgi:hypothetical protein
VQAGYLSATLRVFVELRDVVAAEGHTSDMPSVTTC